MRTKRDQEALLVRQGFLMATIPPPCPICGMDDRSNQSGLVTRSPFFSVYLPATNFQPSSIRLLLLVSRCTNLGVPTDVRACSLYSGLYIIAFWEWSKRTDPSGEERLHSIWAICTGRKTRHQNRQSWKRFQILNFIIPIHNRLMH